MQQKMGPSSSFNATGFELTASQEMLRLVDCFDWAATPLGSAAAWPDSLKAVVRILLTSRFPMWMAWGPDLTVLYNDAYRRTTLGKKHPWALGKPATQVWPEIWKDIGPLIHQVMETGEATWEETLLLILERSGYPEETYHTFSYSPLSGPDDQIVGMLCVVMEDTVRVIGERQLASLSTLAEALSGAISRQDVFAAIEHGLAHQKDMPCTLTYLLDEEGTRLCEGELFGDVPWQQLLGDWDFRGSAKLARFGFALGWLASERPKSIEWNVGGEFEAARKQSEAR